MKVRSWYGLTGEIEVENELWHLVRIGTITLNHPPLVNLILRRGLPRSDRLRLSYLHEFGHFQTLPFALLHLLLLLGSALGRRRSIYGWLDWLTALALSEATPTRLSGRWRRKRTWPCTTAKPISRPIERRRTRSCPLFGPE